MLQNRIIPALTVADSALVKTTNFKKPKYIGDPLNAVRIFNEKEVDEIMLIDINASKKLGPRFIKENKETVNKNALTFNKFVINPIRNEFCKKDFGSLLSEELLKIKKLRPIYSKYKPPKILMNNFASSLL